MPFAGNYKEIYTRTSEQEITEFFFVERFLTNQFSNFKCKRLAMVAPTSEIFLAIIIVSLMVSVHEVACANFNAPIKLDTKTFRCNDYRDRLSIQINFLEFNNNISNQSEQMMLRYQSSEMPFAEDLKTFSSADQNLTVNTYIEGNFQYRFEVVSPSEKRTVCGFDEFIQFGHCDLVEISIPVFDDYSRNESNAGVQICIIKSRSLNSGSIVPYVYMVVLVVVVGTVTAQLIKLSFQKYRRL